ncbi:helix-turn-helix domain-containing protein [Pseudomonas nicosulfuronedens]
MSQAQVSIDSDVGRSTIAKYLSSNQADPANPTLEVICRLAGALGVPVPFLLMTSDDWVRLCHAIDYLNRISDDDRFLNFAKKVTAPENKSSNVEIAEAGLAMAKMIGLLTVQNSRSAQTSSKKKSSIAATCLAPPLSSLDTSFRPMILTLCSIIGASLPEA